MIARALDTLLARALVRRLPVPARVPVVTVGGATLGGSGKTPVAIACAAELARAGARVVLVGHAYRAAPGRARFVEAGDRLDEVGDEALLAARALGPTGARVVVGPSRASAIAAGAAVADVLVLDGVAQLGPDRAALALLAVDAADPWDGPATALPRGRLRAPLRALLAACDGVVPVGPGAPGGIDAEGRPMWPAGVASQGAWVDGGALLTWDALRPLRLGLLCALGRPDRVIRGLKEEGVVLRAIVRARDHGPFGAWARARARSASRGSSAVDLWLATPKCALHAARGLPKLPVAVLDHALVLHADLRERLRRVLA